MAMFFDCRHGRPSYACLVCANGRVEKATLDVAEAQRAETARAEKAQRKADEENRRARKEAKRTAAAEEQRARAEELRQERLDRELAYERSQLIEAERQRVEELRQDREDRNRREAAKEQAADEAAAEQRERTLWRAQYKQDTGIFDEDLVEAAWFRHQDSQDVQRQLDDQITSLRAEAQWLASALEKADTVVAYPAVSVDPLPDDRHVKELQVELANVRWWSFGREAKLRDEIAEARRTYSRELAKHAESLSLRSEWERLSAAVQRLRESWPTMLVDWEILPPRFLDSMEDIPASDSPAVTPRELSERGVQLDWVPELSSARRAIDQFLEKASRVESEVARLMADQVDLDRG